MQKQSPVLALESKAGRADGCEIVYALSRLIKRRPLDPPHSPPCAGNHIAPPTAAIQAIRRSELRAARGVHVHTQQRLYKKEAQPGRRALLTAMLR